MMNANMYDPDVRRRTFVNWPPDGAVQPEDLVRAGFYYTGEGDKVECYECKWQLSNWEANDVPMDEHRKQNPRCRFVNLANDQADEPDGIPQAGSAILTKPRAHWNPERQSMTQDSDQLKYDAYASSLTEMLTDKKTSTPLTVGIFANWGQGKTSVMELIEQKIDKHNEASLRLSGSKGTHSWHTRLYYSSSKCFPKRCRSAIETDGCTRKVTQAVFIQSLFTFILFTVMIIVGVLLFLTWIYVEPYQQVVAPQNNASISDIGATSMSNSTMTSTTPLVPDPPFPTWIKVSVTFLPFMFIVGILVTFQYCRPRLSNSAHRKFFKCFLSFFFYPQVISKAATDIEIILVKFNAWEYAGCDMLWAGIAKNLCDSLVKHFGSSRCSIYRLIKDNYDTAIRNMTSTCRKQKQDKANDKHNITEKLEENKRRNHKDDQQKRLLSKPIQQGNNIADHVKSGVPDKNIEEQKSIKKHPENESLLQQESEIGRDETERCEDPLQPEDNNNENRRFLFPYTVCGIPKHTFYLFVFLLFLLSVFIIVIHIRVGTLHDAGRVFSSLTTIGGISVILATGIRVSMQMFRFIRVPISNLQKVKLDADVEKGLGAMHNIKTEMVTLIEMIQFMEWVDQKQYRVLISVDDLDRCEKSKVLKLLEAISILLSDANSPFISLLAIDPRIVIRAVESKMKEDMNFKNELSFASGHEYLKKIIHLPFWLPKVSKRNIQTLLTSFKTAAGKEEVTTEKTSRNTEVSDENKATSSNTSPTEVDSRDQKQKQNTADMYNHAIDTINNEYRLLSKNPRSLKRIVNVLNMSIRLWCDREVMQSEEEPSQKNQKQVVEKLAWFVVLAEQWPYRLSLLAQIATDKSRKHNHDRWPYKLTRQGLLSDIFKQNSELLRLPEEWKTFITFDIPELQKFDDLLDHCKATLDDLKKLLKYVINLDMSLRESISLEVIRSRLERSEHQDHLI